MFPNEPITLWKELSRIVGNKKKDNAVPPSLTCDKFNEYFANIGSNLTGSLLNPGELTRRNSPCIYSFSLNTIEEACVMKQLKSLPSDNHLDVLDMETRLLNCGASLLAPCVTALFNRSLFSSTLPEDWKLARVIPIYNYKGKGPKTEESNFRPISILGTLSMIIEREVQSQLLSYFVKHDLITIDQFAFLKNHSTVTC